MFSSANALHKEHRSRTLRIGFLTKEAYYFRHPDDLNAILVKNASNYPKSSNTNDLDECAKIESPCAPDCDLRPNRLTFPCLSCLMSVRCPPPSHALDCGVVSNSPKQQHLPSES